MDATGHTEQENFGDREPVLDVVDRVCELCFGLFMALTFVGTVSAVGAGADAGHKMFYTALGCNLAWGLADAVMFLVRTLVARGRRVTLAHSVRSQPNAAAGVRTLRDAMAAWLRPLIGDTELESIRRRVAARPDLPQQAVFVRDDFIAAAAIFVLVVAATFPVALPFVLFAKRSDGADRLPCPDHRDAILQRHGAGALRGISRLAGRPCDGGGRRPAHRGDHRARRMIEAGPANQLRWLRVSFIIDTALPVRPRSDSAAVSA
ncbi:hypothetical protein OKW41_001327 [Paraburkholderia sp. UCT70]